MSKKRKEAKMEKQPRHVILKRRQPNRSRVGDFFVYFFLLLMAVAMVFPLVYAIESALKPLDELFKFPPHCVRAEPDAG